MLYKSFTEQICFRVNLFQSYTVLIVHRERTDQRHVLVHGLDSGDSNRVNDFRNDSIVYVPILADLFVIVVSPSRVPQTAVDTLRILFGFLLDRSATHRHRLQRPAATGASTTAATANAMYVSLSDDVL